MCQINAVEKFKTHFLYSVTFSESRDVYEIMWKKHCKTREATDDNKIWVISVACWICNATDIREEYVTLINFPRQE